MKKSIRIIVTYRVLQHWRAPVFRKLNSLDRYEIKVLHSKGIKGTKLENGRNIKGFEHCELPTIGFSLKSSGRQAPLVFCPTLITHLIKSKPDVILAEGGGNIANNLFVFLYAKVTKTPIVWWTLGEIPGRKYSRTGKAFRKVVSWFERHSTCLIGYSQVALNYFERIGIEKERCFKAVNCVDTDSIFESEAEDSINAQQLVKELNLPPNHTLLFAGALIDSKRIDRLIHSFNLARASFPDLRLIIVGEGAAKDSLVNLCKELGLNDHVIFTGRVIEGIGAYFKASDLFILPGLGGLAISEALAHGVPVICGQGDGCEVDLIENGVNGYRFSPLNMSEEDIVNKISDYINEALRSVQVQINMKRNAKLSIQEKFNIGTYVKQISKALEYATQQRK